MKFKVDTRRICEALSACESLSSKCASQNIKNPILLQAPGEGGICLIATDSENFLRITINAKVYETGEARLPLEELQAILSLCSDNSLFIQIENGQLYLTSGTCKFEIPAMLIEDFPKMDFKEPEGMAVVFVPGELHRYLRLTQYARIRETEEPWKKPLMGTSLERTGKRLCFASSDTKRVAWVYATVVDDAGISQSILSQMFVNNVLKLIPEDQEIKLSIYENTVLVSCETHQLKGKLVEGKYPIWQTQIRKMGNTVVFDRQTLLSSFKAVSIVDEHVKLKIEDGICVISPVCESEGSVKSIWPLPGNPPYVEVNFIASNIIEGLGSMDSDEVELGYNNDIDGISHVMFKMVGVKVSNFFYVVMPLIFGKKGKRCRGKNV